MCIVTGWGGWEGGLYASVLTYAVYSPVRGLLSAVLRITPLSIPATDAMVEGSLCRQKIFSVGLHENLNSSFQMYIKC